MYILPEEKVGLVLGFHLGFRDILFLIRCILFFGLRILEKFSWGSFFVWILYLYPQITRRDEEMAPFVAGVKRNYIFGGIYGIAANASIKVSTCSFPSSIWVRVTVGYTISLAYISRFVPFTTNKMPFQALADMKCINLFGVQQICRNSIALEQVIHSVQRLLSFIICLFFLFFNCIYINEYSSSYLVFSVKKLKKK